MFANNIFHIFSKLATSCKQKKVEQKNHKIKRNGNKTGKKTYFKLMGQFV